MGLAQLRLASLTKFLYLFDRGLDIGQRTGCRTTSHDELKHVSIGHVVNATQIGHDDGHRTAHSRPAAYKNPIVRMVARNPFNSLVQGSRFRLPEFLEGDPFIDHSCGRLGREFFGHQKHGTDLSGRLFDLVNISHEERIRNLIHTASIREDCAHVKRKGARTIGCSPVFVNVILGRGVNADGRTDSPRG